METTVALRPTPVSTPSPDDPDAPDHGTVQRFRSALANGMPWPEALLTAIGEWTAPFEVVDGVRLDYLIEGEAFDWLLLAERLLREAPAGRISSADVERLLFGGVLPDGVSEAEFKSLLGPAKYRAHLNHLYGVVVEEALWYAVGREVEKERSVRGLQHPFGVENLIAERLYRAELTTLLRQFQREHGRGQRVRLTLGESHAFTYWLFKRRVANSDQARIASDTRKGLRMLSEIRERTGAG
ncbi:MAG: hypothetical protein OXL97_06405 [Chloroflexota bacterium]|nr:hypothetical protein [Chloroflexota bacterium]MDE2884890.1 hypothetical protein [Chloroflexota bacterium]